MSPKEGSAKIWYIHVKGKQTGPYSYEYINEKLNKKQISFEDYVYKEGMEDWVQIGTLPQFGSRIPVKNNTHKATFRAKIPEPPSGDDKTWYLCKPDTQEQEGPLSIQETHFLLESGRFGFKDYVWTEEFGDEWKPVEKVKELDRRIRSNMPRMPSTKKIPVNNPSSATAIDGNELSKYSSEELDPMGEASNNKHDVFKVDNTNPYEPLELTKGGECDFLEKEMNAGITRNITESQDSYEAITRTAAVARNEDQINEEDYFTGVNLPGDSTSGNDQASFTQPDIPEDVFDESSEEEEIESTYSSDAFTESIEGETSCSLVNIDNTNTSIDGLTSNMKKKPKPKKNRRVFPKKIVYIFFILSAAGFLYFNFDNLIPKQEIKNFILSILPVDISRFIIKPDVSNATGVLLEQTPAESDMIDYIGAIGKIEGTKNKDKYFFENFNNDYPLKNKSTLKLLEATKTYKTKNHEIMMLQLKLPETPYEEIRKKSALFKRALKKKQLRLTGISRHNFFGEVFSLHEKHGQGIKSISWLKMAAKNTKDPIDKGRQYEQIGDIYDQNQKYADSLKNYREAFKYSKDKNLKEKFKKVSKLYKENKKK